LICIISNWVIWDRYMISFIFILYLQYKYWRSIDLILELILAIHPKAWRIVFLISACKFRLLWILLFYFLFRLALDMIFLTLLILFLLRCVYWVFLYRENILRDILKWFSLIYNLFITFYLELLLYVCFWDLFLYFKHHLVCARLASFIIFTLFTFTQICAIYSWLEAFTVFLLTKGFLTIASLEMSFLFVTYS